MNQTFIDCGALVLFGATGDLAQRMLWPSLYALDVDKLLPENFKLIGAARSNLTRDAFLETLKKTIGVSANAKLLNDDDFAHFAKRIDYLPLDAQNPSSYAAIKTALGQAALDAGVVFYLSTAPQIFSDLCLGLKNSGLVNDKSRVVLEKPMGYDLPSSIQINDTIAQAFKENQVFRIDHYLGKETVQNLLALRFGNAIFEPLWNANHIEQVQITVAETVGAEGRWSYYDGSGALRDMVQSHLLQLLCLVAMEPPASFTPSAVRNEKVKALWSLRPITNQDVASKTVIGQYAAGYANGAPAPGYREEEGANQTSDTETFVAIRAEIDNWRWAGVPFYLRTGKRMPKRLSEIVIQFKAAPCNIFESVGASLQANILRIRLQPDETITLSVMHKEHGLDGVKLSPVGLNLSLGDEFTQSRRRIAYERMIFDVLRGNSALFVRRDEVEAAWTWIDGMIDGWKTTGAKPKPYAAGTWGPAAAIALTERFGHSWHE